MKKHNQPQSLRLPDGRLWGGLSTTIKHKLKWYFELGQRRCHYCGVQMTWHRGGYRENRSATIDHIITRSAGGSLDSGNVLIVCYSCNQRRGDMCFKKFVETCNLPKKEWLMKKYEHAKTIKKAKK